MRMLAGILLILKGLQPLSYAGDDENAMNKKVHELFGSTRQKWGTPEGIQENITRPMTSDGQLTTPDNTRFSAQLGCGSKDSFLELFVLPGATGDLETVTFKQDTTYDGEFDTSVRPGVHISGVCGNGFISCTKGTWEDCQAYEWRAEDKILSGSPTSVSKLGGCYCINNSCGPGLVWKNLEQILQNLASGAATALTRKNSHYAITEITTAETVATVFGQSTSACEDNKKPVNTDYMKDPHKLKLDAFANKGFNDVYQLIFNSEANTDSGSENRGCTIRRTIRINETSLDDIIDYESGKGDVFPCGGDCLRLVLGRIGDDYWSADCGHFQHNVSFNVIRPDRIKSAILIRAKWDDWINVQLEGRKIYAGPRNWNLGTVPSPCELSTSWDRKPNVDFTHHLKTPGRKDFEVHVYVAGKGEGYAYADINVDTSCYLEDDDIHDTCSAWKKDRDCDLYEEITDEVTTVSEFYPTGLAPLPQTRDVIGRDCLFKVKRDYFEIKRTYRCKADRDYTFDQELDRSAYITANTTESAYKDKINVDGETVYKDGKLVILDTIAVDTCTKACKTRRQIVDNAVSHSGVVSERTTSNTKWQYTYKACVDNTCPHGDDEEILADCECLDQFSEAVASMHSIRMAGGDAICSDGEKKK